MEILWLGLALDDLEALHDYISQDKPDAAVRINARIISQMETLVRHPERGRPGRIAGTRASSPAPLSSLPIKSAPGRYKSSAYATARGDGRQPSNASRA